ncbi:hypothetical protein HK102_010888 [Quaeritorhiza haematococci]|nr:hypothetical protein HK102_010888 [Quaeritorhiza haematococci]
MADVKVDVYRPRIKEILAAADLETITAKKIRKQLENEFSVDLSEERKAIDGLIMELLDGMADGEGNVATKEEEDEKKPLHTATTAKFIAPPPDKAPPKRKSTNSGGAGSARKKVKSEDFVSDDDESGSDDDEHSSMTPEEQEAADEAFAKRLQQEEEGGRRSRRASTRASTNKRTKKVTRGKKDADGAEKPKRQTAFTKPLVLSPVLSDFLGGVKQMGRTDVVKNIWAYIKEHDLQDPKDKRNIMCDASLQEVFGKAKIGMFEMNKLLKDHLAAPEELAKGTVASEDDDD